MGLGKRFSEAVASGRAAVRAIEQGEPFAPGPQPGLGALVVGLSAAEIAELAPSVLVAARREGARAVLLTDATDIAVFQLPEIATEYLAPLPGLAAAAPGRDAELYLRRRLMLICAQVEPRAGSLLRRDGGKSRARVGRELAGAIARAFRFWYASRQIEATPVRAAGRRMR